MFPLVTGCMKGSKGVGSFKVLQNISLGLIPNMDISQVVCVSLTFGKFVLASYNIALRKPAYQSSVFVKVYSTDPGNIVDGNLARNINYGSCSVTENEDLNPWWMVDLEEPFKIHNITVVNRGDASKEYLHDFYIELFLEDPLTSNSATPQQCLFYNGILYDVETLSCEGPVIGRYVKIRKIPRAGQAKLMLCEVEIRGVKVPKLECGSNSLPIQVGKMLQTSFKEVVASDSLPDCFNRCNYNLDCYDINYSGLTQSCEMILARSDTDVLLDDQDWRYVSLA